MKNAMKNILFVIGAVLGFAGLVAVAALVVMFDSLKIQMGLGDYALSIKFGLLGLVGFAAMGGGWWMWIMKKME